MDHTPLTVGDYVRGIVGMAMLVGFFGYLGAKIWIESGLTIGRVLRGIFWLCVWLAVIAIVLMLPAILPAMPHVSFGTGVIIVLLVMILVQLRELAKRNDK
jgi:hypothetical protein